MFRSTADDKLNSIGLLTEIGYLVVASGKAYCRVHAVSFRTKFQ